MKEGELQSVFLKSVSGTIEVLKNGKNVCEITGDNFINLYEILNKTKSVFTFKAKTEVRLWSVEEEPFNLFVKEELKQYLVEKYNFIKDNTIFSGTIHLPIVK